ncbi:MAG TPA: DUF1702 family protein [Candidatus Dormibacteraeota bacterium]|nr:DUF1702 family protein [Candidatus Dormibacteraeota bacterium]
MKSNVIKLVNPLRTLLGPVCRWVFGLHREETTYTRRGFRGASKDMQRRLGDIGAAFLNGYHTSLRFGCSDELIASLESSRLELRGFAYEGAAMGLALLDILTPWKRDRVSAFLQRAGSHIYMVHVGVGWLWARLPRCTSLREHGFHPLLRWLAFDGWGFHEGYFHWAEYVSGKQPTKTLVGYETRAFDQGLGRSFWFVNGGDPGWITRTMSGFAASRRPDLWSGMGLAAAYAGMVSESALLELTEAAGNYWPQLAQGAAFGLKARERAGNTTDYNELAAQVLCGMSATEAAALTDTALEQVLGISPSGAPAGLEPVYEQWRQKIQEHFIDHQSVALTAWHEHDTSVHRPISATTAFFSLPE